MNCPKGLAFWVVTLDDKIVKLLGFTGSRVLSRTLVYKVPAKSLRDTQAEDYISRGLAFHVL
jgi:hypothetical protein